MISTVTNDKCYEFRGLSTDEKPVNWDANGKLTGKRVGNGSVFIACDTKQIFMFDEEHNVWIEL